MRRIQKNMILELAETFDEAHKSAEIMLRENNIENARMLLVDCQKTAVQIVDIIKKSEGLNCPAIVSFSEYCSAVFNSFQEISAGNIEIDFDELSYKLNNAKKCIKDIKEKLEVVLFPYKASMWDSLESIWKAANDDPDCDAYVVPIPYYDRNPDHSLGKFHYEGNEYPDYVPITDYRRYDYKARRPDIAYIHNPYDDCNYVTSVHPDYYSRELKKYTDHLVYVPYYATSGGMSEGQYSAPAYYNADYIVIQSEKYRRYFDSKLDDSKFLPYGSPKFDRVINMCKNKPDVPKEWSSYINGKKVFFYNTSISGLLRYTATFLNKLAYVIECFENREDAVLIWRPHPLLESTLKSMRPQYLETFLKIKEYFVSNKVGIYDDTPDIEKTISLSDAYIGDTGTSVTSLFGVAGKPIFALNNLYSELPGKNDYQGIFLTYFGMGMMDCNSVYIPYMNTLFELDRNTLRFRKIRRLSKYYGAIYSHGIRIGKRIYVCPKNAQNILVVENDEVIENIELDNLVENRDSFIQAYNYKNYIVLIPRKYPAIVRYNIKTGEIKYIRENIDTFKGMINGTTVIGGSCIRNNLIFIGSPVSNLFFVMNIDTCKTQVISNCSVDSCGCKYIVDDGKDLWFIPYRGCTVTRMNPLTAEHKDYCTMPEGFGEKRYCEDSVYSSVSLFTRPAVCGNMIYLPPARANMFVSINKLTGEVSEWKASFELPDKYRSVYYINDQVSNTKYSCIKLNGKDYLLYSFCEGIFYKIDFKNGEYEKIEPEIDIEVLRETEAGFDYWSLWQQYICLETAFNTLSDFIDGNITGKSFDKDKQINAYNDINASPDGTCGKKVHKRVKEGCGI